MIYFAQLPTGSIKIGYSFDVNNRMDQLRGHYGAEPALLHVMRGDRQTERSLHERFAHLRLGRSEQFQPGPDLMEFIGRPLLVSSNPDAVEAVDPRKPDICLTLPRALHARIQAATDQEGNSVAAFIRSAVVRELKRREKENTE